MAPGVQPLGKQHVIKLPLITHFSLNRVPALSRAGL